MKIALITQYYPPERTRLVSTLAHALKDRGHEVRVVTGFPNYPEGKLFDGYEQGFGLTEDDEGVPVRRVPLVVSHSQNPIGRILNYVSFGLSVLGASRFTQDSDVVYVYATQMTAAIAPAWWRRVRGQPYVLHVQDIWPESIAGANMLPDWAARIASTVLTPWLRGTYRRAAAVVGISETMTQTLIQRGAPDTSRTIYNWAVRDEGADNHAEGSSPHVLRLVYGGNIGEMQDFSTVIEALEMAGDLPGLQVDIYGAGVLLDEVRERAVQLGLKAVRFHGWVDPSTMARAYQTADFTLVPLKDLPLFEMTIPSKFQASMSAGIPVITTAGGDLAHLVNRHGVGFSANPGDPGALASAIRKAQATTTRSRLQMGKRARSLYEKEMSFEAALNSFEEVLASANLTKKAEH